MHSSHRKDIQCLLIIFLLCVCLTITIIFILEHEPSHYVAEEEEEPWDNLQLFNLRDFSYLLNPRPCSIEDFAVVIVTSYAGDVETRSSLRQAYPDAVLKTLKLRRMFLLAVIDPKKNEDVTQEAIENENKRFGDIVQGNFIENYRNLTYKHIMGLNWASENCREATYVIKMDHDIVVDFYSLVKLLQDVPERQTLLLGNQMTNMKPIREPANKWYVSSEEFSEEKYPDFLSGWLYVTNPFTARLLCLATKTVPYFWIDDTYVTGLLASKLAVPLVSLNSYFTTHPRHLECCISQPQLSCDYWVGPNGGDNRLVKRFQAYCEKCYRSKCKRRLRGNFVRDTCKTFD